MVKRAKSPDVIDDAKYLICYHPWPHNAGWELEGDYVRFCRWLACIIGPDALFAFHYKPAARGTVLIEVDKTCPKLDLLLGEHRWIEFLKNPSEEEMRLKENSSKIFYSIYGTARAAQKDGWKRVHVESRWFNEWSPINPVIRNPYPATHWCEVPSRSEDPTNKNMYHPLPVSVKPPPPKVAPPVVGSSAWFNTKAAPPPTQEAVQGVWAEGMNSIAGGSSSAKPKPKPVATVNAWANRPINKITPAASPVSPVSPAGKRVWGGNAPTANAVAPVPAARAVSASPYYPAPPGLTRTSTAPSAALGLSRTVSSAPGSSNVRTLTDQFVGISLSPSQERNLYAVGGSDGDEEEEDPNELEVSVLAPWERVTETEGATEGDLWGNVQAKQDEVVENLWGEEMEKKAPEVILCPTHKMACKKGICRDMAKIVRDMEREKKNAERNAAATRKRKGVGPSGWKKGATPAGKTDEGAVPVRGRGQGAGKGGAWGTTRTFAGEQA